MKIIKLVRSILIAMALGLSFKSMAHEQGILKGAKAAMGIGCSFGKMAMFNLQLGTDLLIMQEENFTLHAGPLVFMSFGSKAVGGDLDGSLKATYNFLLPDDMSLHIYGKTFLGISFASIGTGFNLGITPGAEFYFSGGWGVFTELGFLHRSYFHQNIAGWTGLHFPSVSYNLGAIYRF